MWNTQHLLQQLNAGPAFIIIVVVVLVVLAADIAFGPSHSMGGGAGGADACGADACSASSTSITYYR